MNSKTKLAEDEAGQHDQQSGISDDADRPILTEGELAFSAGGDKPTVA